MNQRENSLLSARVARLKAELSAELQKPKAERRGVELLQVQINTVRGWLGQTPKR